MKKKKHESKFRLVVSGSGTAGHITPLLAVCQSLKSKMEDLEIIYIGQNGDRFSDLVDRDASVDRSLSILAGKWRRYHGRGWRQIFDIKSHLLNIRDLFLVVAGTIEALVWLRSLKPQAVFLKGGYIGVPVGLAAALYKIPIVTHDSDAHPGLANRIVARWVDTHLVANDAKLYPYPFQDTVSVGNPIKKQFFAASKKDQLQARKSLNLPEKSKIILVLGGSIGARRLNQAINQLLASFSSIGYLVVAAGKGNLKYFEQANINNAEIFEFTDRVDDYLAASDLVISRGGASTLAEVCAVGRPLVIVPNAQLTNNHQSKNAEIYADKGAAVVIEESAVRERPEILVETVKELLNPKFELKNMLKAQTKMVDKRSAPKIADILKNALSRSLRYRNGR